MLGPDPSIEVSGSYPLHESDVREIARLLPALGVEHGITSIYMEGPDRAKVYCETRHAMDLETRDGGEGLEFTVVRKNGRWGAIGRPEKTGRVILCAWMSSKAPGSGGLFRCPP